MGFSVFECIVHHQIDLACTTRCHILTHGRIVDLRIAYRKRNKRMLAIRSLNELCRCFDSVQVIKRNDMRNRLIIKRFVGISSNSDIVLNGLETNNDVHLSPYHSSLLTAT